MTNAEKFQEVFGIYATEMWAMSEQDFLKWLNADTPQTDLPAEEFVEGMKNLKMEVERTDCDRYAIVNDEGEREYNCIGCQTGCPYYRFNSDESR